jgi:hypothetical protein
MRATARATASDNAEPDADCIARWIRLEGTVPTISVGPEGRKGSRSSPLDAAA